MKDANQHTMTTNDPTPVDGTPVTEQKRVVEALTKALETEEVDEKDYQIRQALQLLALKNG
ncbi:MULTISPECIES: hypothetical protein [Halorussus]|uniref:hypothetical protein n=1 Tax=Halorussus TaxID=1070314 RepID=UPI000E210744|nr:MULTISPECIES: hypothetical protein [Halorussus]NHN57703.1 hypothetical protein [Halorussus sp. JP-T4]